MKKYLAIYFLFIGSIISQNNNEYPQIKIAFNPEKYICYKTIGKITIDGKFNEKDWEKAEWTKDFVDIEGDLKPKPYYNTRVKMLWDDEYFYFAALLEEPHIWAKLKQRDTVIFYDNDFEIFIDPDGDTHKYYEFEINAFNTQWDLMIVKPYRDGENVALNGWDIAGLKTAVDINGTINNPNDEDKYWTVEVAYPWKALAEMTEMKSPPLEGDQWRVNFSRVEWDTEIIDGTYKKKINPKTGKSFPENNWVWSSQGIVNMHSPETWGYTQFTNKLVGTEKVEFNLNTDEYAKWALRKVYYAEHDYKLINGNFTDEFEKLKIKNLDIHSSYIWPPKIKITSTQFEAILLSKDEKNKYIIYQDGLVKKQNVSNEN
ncbi:MAG: carbohydrate-binding family 9-like protein [Ignavibacteriae bacterium]|nr:carbohydrate-binding family 9-like protein [Ignavibacteriota bacterium]